MVFLLRLFFYHFLLDTYYVNFFSILASNAFNFLIRRSCELLLLLIELCFRYISFRQLFFREYCIHYIESLLYVNTSANFCIDLCTDPILVILVKPVCSLEMNISHFFRLPNLLSKSTTFQNLDVFIA